MRSVTSLGALMAVTALLIGGCDGGDIVDNYPPGAILELLDAPLLDPPSVTEENGDFVVRSTIPFTCQPYTLKAEVTENASLLTLRVVGRKKDGCHQDISGSTAYRATLISVHSGTYHLRLIQSHRELAIAPDTIEFGEIAVP